MLFRSPVLSYLGFLFFTKLLKGRPLVSAKMLRFMTKMTFSP